MTSVRRFGFRDALLTGLALILFIGFCSLGTWQLNRRAWKLDLIAHVDQQLQQAPSGGSGA